MGNFQNNPDFKKEKDIYNMLDSLCDSINILNELKSIYNIDDELFLQLIQTDDETKKVSIRKDFFNIFTSKAS